MTLTFWPSRARSSDCWAERPRWAMAMAAITPASATTVPRRSRGGGPWPRPRHPRSAGRSRPPPRAGRRPPGCTAPGRWSAAARSARPAPGRGGCSGRPRRRRPGGYWGVGRVGRGAYGARTPGFSVAGTGFMAVRTAAPRSGRGAAQAAVREASALVVALVAAAGHHRAGLAALQGGQQRFGLALEGHQLLAGEALVLRQVHGHRIDLGVVHQHLVVQVRAGAAAGVAGERDALAHGDPVAAADQRPRQVQVAGLVAVVVADHDVAARGRVVGDLFHAAVRRCDDGRADGHGEVGALVGADAAGDRVLAARVEAGAHAVAALEGVAGEGRVEALAEIGRAHV